MDKKTIHKVKSDNLLEKLTKEVEVWKGKYLRALADYQNLEKRVLNLRSEEAKQAAKDVIIKILPVLDLLYKVQAFLKNESLDLVIKELEKVLKSEGVEKIEVLGKKFDPYLMECTEVEEGKSDGEVVEELLSGYRLQGKVLRVAKVKVGKQPIPEEVKPKTEEKKVN